MSLLALSYPTLNDHDLEWIQSIRIKHDMNFKMLAPHFTLIFPEEDIEQDQFIDHVSEVVRNENRINFMIKCAFVNYSASEKSWYLFLVPDSGFSDIMRLHDKLYSGILTGRMRLDIPFIPHMTIGHFDDGEACKSVADEINATSFEVSGLISSIDIVTYVDRIIETIDKVELQ
jgi:2'-5' RNA ligase